MFYKENLSLIDIYSDYAMFEVQWLSVALYSYLGCMLKQSCLFLCANRTPGRQLRLFDVRLRQTEVHAFGWKQESSESQSALINQSWSPDGWYVSSGSADPVIHIFDIRHHGQNPCQSVQAHQKRVFKAVWHQTLPYLTSISSDLNIGIHRYS
jgi:WD40 repeat protein